MSLLFEFNNIVNSFFCDELCTCSETSSTFTLNCNDFGYERKNSMPSFESLRRNVSLRKSFTIKITNKSYLRVLNSTFSAMTVSDLDLSFNNIEQVDSTTFDEYRSLEHVEFSRKPIKKLE
jgi:hypothetical protein